ncbi:MAG: hypothetical protein KC653_00610 [Candidatus Andersenbacteria bacterium]|nr:hypothetical protein [Candidatus Andersenbacteria bacterium]
MVNTNYPQKKKPDARPEYARSQPLEQFGQHSQKRKHLAVQHVIKIIAAHKRKRRTQLLLHKVYPTPLRRSYKSRSLAPPEEF